MRERLLAGEELTNRGVQAEYGISNDHTVSDAAAKLRHAGHSVIKDKRIEKGPAGRAVVQTYWRVEQVKAEPVRKSRETPAKRGSPKNSVSEQLRQRLIDGEALSAQQAVEQYGVSRSLLGVVVAQMREDGLTVETERVPGGQALFRLVGSSNQPDTHSHEEAPRERPKSRRAIYADLVRRFEAGERIDAHMVMNDYGVKQIRFLAGFLNTQRKKGWIFTKASRHTDDGWRTSYRLKWAQSKKKPPAWVDEPPTEEPEQVVDVTDRPEHPLHPGPLDLPQLGMTLRVTLLAEGDEGEIVLGLKNGVTSWMVTLRG